MASKKSMTRKEFIRILKLAQKSKDPEITFWIGDDIYLELESLGEFSIMPEITVNFKIGGNLQSPKDSAGKIKKGLLKKLKV